MTRLTTLLTPESVGEVHELGGHVNRVSKVFGGLHAVLNLVDGIRGQRIGIHDGLGTHSQGGTVSGSIGKVRALHVKIVMIASISIGLGVQILRELKSEQRESCIRKIFLGKGAFKKCTSVKFGPRK